MGTVRGQSSDGGWRMAALLPGSALRGCASCTGHTPGSGCTRQKAAPRTLALQGLDPPTLCSGPCPPPGPPRGCPHLPSRPPPQRGWAAQPSVGLAPLFCPPPNRCPLGQCQPLFQPLNFTCSQLPQAPLGRALTCAECGALSAAAASEATSNAMLVPPIARARLARPQALPASELHLFVLTFFCHCCHLCHPL